MDLQPNTTRGECTTLRTTRTHSHARTRTPRERELLDVGVLCCLSPRAYSVDLSRQINLLRRANLLLFNSCRTFAEKRGNKAGSSLQNRKQMAMYIRVKRSKTTYFISCDATETILDIKQKLSVLIEQPAHDQRLVLVGSGEVLDDSKTLADQKVENDAVVALTMRKDDNQFEDVNIVRPSDFYQSRDAEGGNW